MQLKYRGIAYEPTAFALPLASRIIGHYRGAEVSTHFLTEPLHQYTLHSLIYRGVRYGTPVSELQDYTIPRDIQVISKPLFPRLA